MSKYVINASVVSDDGKVTMYLGVKDDLDPLFLYRVDNSALIHSDGTNLDWQEIDAICQFERMMQVKNAKFNLNPIMRVEYVGAYATLVKLEYLGDFFYMDHRNGEVWDEKGKLRYDILEVLQEQERRDRIKDANFV